MRRLSARSCLSAVLFLVSLIILSQCQTLSVLSSSNYVGDTSVNYTFVLSNISAVSSVTFSFNQWAPLSTFPYNSGSKCYMGTTLLTCISFPSNVINCALSLTGSGQSFNLTLTGMSNPSSTKPYTINLTITNSTNSLTLSKSLTVTSLLSYPVSFQGYSRTIGATSSAITMDVVMNNYIDSTTFLSLTYNSTLITITFPNTTAYTVLSNNNGTVLISNWNSLTYGKVSLTAVAITNPQAAITYSISGLFYFKSGNVTYDIQTVSTSVVLSPVAFSSFTVASPLSYGALTPLTITSACNFTQVANASNQSYTTVDFPTELQPTNASNCTITSSTRCQHSRSGSYSLTNFQVGIGSYNSTSLTFTSFTFYAGAFYGLCRATATVSFTLQSTVPYTVSSECDTNITSLNNTINIYTNIQSVATGDVVYISGIKGVITNTNIWSTTTINSTVWYITTLISSNIATNGSTSTVTLPLSYSNPNQTSLNSITQLSVYRNGSQYAAMSNSSSVSICSITAARPITSYSIVPSTLNTYDIINVSLAFTMQIYDYAYNDYMDLQISSTGLARQYFLAGSLVNITPNLTVNGVYCTFTITNDYTVRIVLGRNVSLPSSTSPTLTIILFNLVNPPAVDTYWFGLTTWDQPTGGSKEILSSSSTLTIKAASILYSISNLYELVNNTISFTVSNVNRPILSKNNVSASTTLTITLPSTISCSGFTNNTRTTTWNVGITTSNTLVSGNTTNLTISLGSCFVYYFATSASLTLSESFNGVQSTSTTVSVGNKCGSCYQCSSTNFTCSACFNSTYTTSIYYYQNQCYTACPNKTYTSNSSCLDCHSSCQTCTGPLFTNCTSCSQNFSLVNGYCSSVCGSGKYESNGTCLSCHVNCQSCLSPSVCYVCNTGAVMIGTVCQYSSCTSPCLTCEGSLTSCTSCMSSQFLYGSKCYQSCPTGTYPKGTLCSTVSESSTYVPVTITGAVCVVLLMLLRVYSSKKIGNQSRRTKNYEQDEEQLKYKINLLRVVSVLYSLLELVAALVLLLKDSTYEVGSKAVAATLVGMVFHLLCNIAFLIGYIRMVCLKRVDNDHANETGETSNTTLRQKAIIILSTLLTFRAYKLLDANLFMDRKLPEKSKDAVPSRKLIRSNSLGDDPQDTIIMQPTDSVMIVPRRSGFQHPFLTYLTLLNFCLGTLPILIGAVLQILGWVFTQMILWGIDCLLVGVASLALTAWDLWVFTNLRRSEQHSEMSSQQQVNNTHENLKQIADIDIKIQPEKPALSPKRSTTRPKLSQRTQKAKEKEDMSMEGVRAGIKRQCDEETVAREEQLPHLKVFEDFDEKDDNVLGEKKTKKFSTKNLRRGDKKMSSRRINATSHRRNALGEMCDDLYINFGTEEGTRPPTLNATYLHSRPSASPNRSLQEESIEVGGEFQDQPPNFADISDIQQGAAEAINISLSSGGPAAI